MKKTYISKSVEDTIRVGSEIAMRLKRGDIVALVGELGSGKTVLTKGIAKALNVKNVRYVNSPTFVIIKEYKGKIPLYHFDLYRLNKSSMIDSETYEEYFYGDGVTVIEWAEKIRRILPKNKIWIKFKIVGRRERIIIFK